MLEFILFVALIILLVVLRKPLSNMLIGGLDKRSERIRTDLDEAARLHAEAKALLEKHQAKLAEGEGAAADILAHAEKESKALQARLAEDLEKALERREVQAMERIAQEESRALREVRGRATDLAIRTTRQILGDQLEEGNAAKIMEGAIGEVRRKLA